MIENLENSGKKIQILASALFCPLFLFCFIKYVLELILSVCKELLYFLNSCTIQFLPMYHASPFDGQ